MYTTTDDAKAALDRVGELQRGIQDQLVDPVAGADEIVQLLTDVVNFLLMTGTPGAQIYSGLLEPLAEWNVHVVALEFLAKDETPRTRAMKACFDRLKAVFDKFKHLENAD